MLALGIALGLLVIAGAVVLAYGSREVVEDENRQPCVNSVENVSGLGATEQRQVPENPNESVG